MVSKKRIQPEKYSPILNIEETEKAIKLIKDFFQTNLALELNLFRMTAPMFVRANTGLNDNLTGVEEPVSFNVKAFNGNKVEIVQSLAKWKRLKLADLKVKAGMGIYTDMNAIRPDEELDSTHSLYVDQWDWEKVISDDNRNIDYIKRIVKKIYNVIVRTEKYVYQNYNDLVPLLPEKIKFFHSEDLAEEYPELSSSEREYKIAKEFGAVFIIGIGGKLKNGEPHDFRAPDYDDWSTKTGRKHKGLNGDIIIYNPVLDSAFELSSMGIRVDPESLERQLKISKSEDRRDLFFHRQLLGNKLPQTIGGGIGQSRLCMYFLRKAHIGEIQCSLWSEEIISECKQLKIPLL